jgi:WD40 repeat protein
MTNKKPVLLFAFANERQKDTTFLRALSDERRAIEAALASAERDKLCEVKMLPNATLKELLNVFQDNRYRDRIAVFHYGGHAGSFDLLLEKNDRENAVAHRDGLVSLLKNQKALQLVFLNGCNTEQWAHKLNDAGIPLVAGTFQAIPDQDALELASRFYSALAQGMPIRRAWDEAVSYTLANIGNNLRSVGFHAAVSDRFPWELFQRKGAELANDWNLPDASGDPLLALPLPQYHLPNEPFRFLDRYRKADAPIFFGRGYDIRNMHDRITSPTGSPLLLLSGQSGVGKSSMLEAGLLPRLENSVTVLYQRRNPQTGLYGTLCEALKVPTETTEELLNNWKKLEQKHGKPLVLMLDQVEEAITRKDGAGIPELDQLAQTLCLIFSETATRPQGKIVLSFRKEYESNIEDVLRTAKLDFTTVFLKPLSAEGISEVVNGLSSNLYLQDKYGLHIQSGLAGVIAADLLTDSDTPVSPVLQIILTKLWEIRGDERSFTTEKYLRLKEEGIYLGDFLKQQMVKLGYWEEKTGHKVVSSGLALDVLHSHTSELGFANSRSVESLQKAYEHRADVLDELIKQFKELYLLTDIGENRNALAHDTLASIVLQAVHNSDKPAQKALRILTSKIANFKRDITKTYLDETDLALVEQGKNSMRLWVDAEPELVRKSQERRAVLRRQRRLVWMLIIGLGVAASWFGYRQFQSTQIERWVSQARLEAGADPTFALKTLQKAVEVQPDNPVVLAVQYDIWSDNEFYTQKTVFAAAIKGVLISPDTSCIIYSWTDHMLYRCNRQGVRLDSFATSGIAAVVLSPDGKNLMVSSVDGQLVWLDAATLRQQYATRVLAPEYATQLVYSADGSLLLAAGTGDDLIAIRLQNAPSVVYKWRLPARISTLRLHPFRHTLLAGFEDGTAAEYNLQGQLLLSFSGHSDQVLSFAVSPVDSSIATSGRDALIIFHNPDGAARLSIKGHDRRINQLQWSTDGSRLFSAGNDHLVKAWSPEGDLISVYRGHTAFVNALAMTPDGQHFVSGADDYTIRIWKIESKVKQRFGPHPAGVSGLWITKDGKHVYTVSDAGLSTVGETLNDQDFDFDALISMQFGGTPRSLLRWDARSGVLQHEWKGHKGGINSLDGNGSLLLTASDDSTAIVWNMEGVPQKMLAKQHSGKVMGAAISADGEKVVTVGEDKQVVLWDKNGVAVKTIKQADLVRAVAFTPDGKLFATAGYDGKVQVYDAAGNDHGVFGSGGNQRVECLCFAPDGQSLLTGSWSNTAILYDLKGKVLATFSLRSENKTGGKAIKSVAISADGKYFALGAEGGLVQVYQLVNSHPTLVRQMQHYPKNAVLSLRFSPDGKGLLTGTGGGWARWWGF